MNLYVPSLFYSPVMNVMHELGNCWVFPVLLAEETFASEAVLVTRHYNLIHIPSWHHQGLHVLVQLIGDGEPVNDHSLTKVAGGVYWEDLSDIPLRIPSFRHLWKPIVAFLLVGNNMTFDFGLLPTDPLSTFTLWEKKMLHTRVNTIDLYESSPERREESWRAVEGVYQLHCVPAQGVRCTLLLHSSSH